MGEKGDGVAALEIELFGEGCGEVRGVRFEGGVGDAGGGGGVGEACYCG